MQMYAFTALAEEGAGVPLRPSFGEIGNTTVRYWAIDQIWDKGEGKVRVW